MLVAWSFGCSIDAVRFSRAQVRSAGLGLRGLGFRGFGARDFGSLKFRAWAWV